MENNNHWVLGNNCHGVVLRILRARGLSLSSAQFIPVEEGLELVPHLLKPIVLT